MKWRISAATVGIIIVIFIWSGNRGTDVDAQRVAARESSRTAAGEFGEISADDDGPSRTKASHRETLPPPASHSVQQLKEFILPEISIQGVSLEAALQQVKAAYEKTCRETGESPLTLKFKVPPENGRTLRVTLTGQYVTQSIRLLAGLAGTKLVRDGVEFRFEPIPEDGKLVKKVLRVPPDFASALDALSGTVRVSSDPNDPSAPPPAFIRGPVSESLEKLGLSLDPATKVVLSPNGELALETTRSADAAGVDALVKLMGESKPKQLKYTTKTITLPADSDWKMPDLKQLEDADVQMMMRELSQKRGVELTTFPSVTGRFGQGTKMEIVNDLPLSGGEAADAEPLRVGKTLDLHGNAIGFGQNVAFDYQDTEGDTDAVSGQPVIKTNAKIASTSFCKDGRTLFSVERRPDGSRVLLMVTAAQIDATGRTLHGE